MISGALFSEITESRGRFQSQIDAQRVKRLPEVWPMRTNDGRIVGGQAYRAVQTGIDLPLEAGLALERELQAKLFSSNDARRALPLLSKSVAS